MTASFAASMQALDTLIADQRAKACVDCGETGELAYGHPNSPSPLRIVRCTECGGAGWRAVEAEEDGQPDEAQEWADYDRGC